MSELKLIHIENSVRKNIYIKTAQIFESQINKEFYNCLFGVVKPISIHSVLKSVARRHFKHELFSNYIYLFPEHKLIYPQKINKKWKLPTFISKFSPLINAKNEEKAILCYLLANNV